MNYVDIEFVMIFSYLTDYVKIVDRVFEIIKLKE